MTTRRTLGNPAMPTLGRVAGANAAAALAVTRIGAATSPTRAELDRFLDSNGP